MLGGLTLLLAAGIGFTYRNVSKEMELAKPSPISSPTSRTNCARPCR